MNIVNKNIMSLRGSKASSKINDLRKSGNRALASLLESKIMAKGGFKAPALKKTKEKSPSMLGL